MKTMFNFGVDYYPEQRPEERWLEDARLMTEAGINVVRLAEFASVLGWVLELSGIKPVLTSPQGVEVTERCQGNRRLLFILNHIGNENYA